MQNIKTDLKWIPFPALISVMLVFILTLNIFIKINFRIYNSINPIKFTNEKNSNIDIWVSIKKKDDFIQLNFDDQKKINSNQYNILDKYIKKKLLKYALHKALSNTASDINITISPDINIRYSDMKQIIAILAKNKIYQYNIETLNN